MHRGIIRIDNRTFLGLLQYYGGHIISIRDNELCDAFDVLIEHNEMPAVQPGEAYQIVNPTYMVDTDALGRRTVRRASASGHN